MSNSTSPETCVIDIWNGSKAPWKHIQTLQKQTCTCHCKRTTWPRKEVVGPSSWSSAWRCNARAAVRAHLYRGSWMKTSMIVSKTSLFARNTCLVHTQVLSKASARQHSQPLGSHLDIRIDVHTWFAGIQASIGIRSYWHINEKASPKKPKQKPHTP